MKKKAFTTELIIEKLREAEVLFSQWHELGEISRKLGISEQAYYL
jgi:putative transposase